MHAPSDPTLRALLGELDDLWRGLDEVWATLTPGDWSCRHGSDWRVDDLPYHLACFDRDLVARAIVRGPEVPVAEMYARNAAQLARRPAGTTTDQDLAEMGASRERIRDATGVLSGADLDRPVWCPLPGLGWQTVRGVLTLCIDHTRGHLDELRQQLQPDEPSPDTAADQPRPDLAPTR